MSESVGTLIKAARTKAGLSQNSLAEKIDGLSASDISKAERGEKMLTNDQLKAIAKNTGVTQKSLLEAAAAEKEKTAGSTSGKTSGSNSGKTSGSTSSKTDSKTGAKTSSMEVTSAEKKLVQLYRKADSDVQKQVMTLLKGDDQQDASALLESLLEGGDTSELLGNLLTSAVGAFAKKADKK